MGYKKKWMSNSGKISELVNVGVTTVDEMRHHLNEYVRWELFAGTEIPAPSNRRFFPTKKHIINHMYHATVKNHFSNCDQVKPIQTR